MENRFYTANEVMIKKPNNNKFHLHNHEFYEIYMFSKGDTEYIVEGNTYILEPDDIIIIRRHEMHRAYHKSECEYKRTVLQVYPEFFENNGCKKYERTFLNPDTEGNKISADIVQKTGLKDAFFRLKKYSSNYKDIYSPVCRSIVIEILYIISCINNFSGDNSNNSTVKDIIHYINNNFSENISLDDLAERFYISKYHICKIFKEATGHTVHSYITRKRITRVKELRQEGKRIGEAAYISGFRNYTSFYRSYLKEFGTPPGKAEK